MRFRIPQLNNNCVLVRTPHAKAHGRGRCEREPSLERSWNKVVRAHLHRRHFCPLPYSRPSHPPVSKEGGRAEFAWPCAIRRVRLSAYSQQSFDSIIRFSNIQSHITRLRAFSGSLQVPSRFPSGPHHKALVCTQKTIPFVENEKLLEATAQPGGLFAMGQIPCTKFSLGIGTQTREEWPQQKCQTMANK